jgi:hypothetical protein
MASRPRFAIAALALAQLRVSRKPGRRLDIRVALIGPDFETLQGLPVSFPGQY